LRFRNRENPLDAAAFVDYADLTARSSAENFLALMVLCKFTAQFNGSLRAHSFLNHFRLNIAIAEMRHAPVCEMDCRC
jgi:hypothetical protein